MLDPVPRRSHRLHLPVSSSVSAAFPTKRLGRLPASFREYDFSRGDFRGCRYSFMFRPLSLLALQVVPTAAHIATGQPELLHPGISCIVASARTGSGRRWRIGYPPTLATVRRPNRACRFPAHGFHEDSDRRDAREGINPTRLTSPCS